MSVILPNFLLFLLMLAVAVVGVVFIVSVVRSGSHNGPPPGPWAPQVLPNPAVAELDLRYARGEIERDDYLRRRADLLGQAASFPPGAPTGPATTPS